jgi:hypothetical protein
MVEALVILLCLGWLVIGRARERRRFASHLVGMRCPWCKEAYCHEAARRSTRGQSIRSRAFAVGCLRCQRVQLLVPGPSLAKWQNRRNSRYT